MESRDERIEYLAERQSRGEMDPRDLAELKELCRDPEGARAFVEALADRHEWREWAGRTGPAEKFVESVLERSRDASGQDFVRSVTEKARRSSRRPTRRTVGRQLSSTWIILASAAALLVAVIVAAAMSGGPTAPSKPADARKAEPRVDPVPQPELPKVEPRRVVSAPPKLDFPKPPAPTAPGRVRRGLPDEREAPRDPKPKNPPPDRTPATPRKTVARAVETIVGKIAALRGEAWIVVKGRREAAQDGRPLRSGEGLQTTDGVVRIRLADESLLTIERKTIVEEIADESGTVIRLTSGAVRAEVAKQPANRPMRFLTKHGEATVVGTVLGVTAEERSTRLEVLEGRVRLRRLSDGKSVNVVSGHFAIAGPGVALRSRRLPTDEILLDASDGSLTGSDWEVVSDPASATGDVLEAKITRRLTAGMSLKDLRSWATFRFYAEAGKTYVLWVRGRCVAPPQTALVADGINVSIEGAAMFWPDGRRESLFVNYNGFANRQGYWWVGGDGDLFGAQGKRLGLNPGGNARHGDEIPVRVRFNATGMQTLKLYPNESPMRVDALWLSRSQTTRPADAATGPRGTRR